MKNSLNICFLVREDSSEKLELVNKLQCERLQFFAAEGKEQIPQSPDFALKNVRITTSNMSLLGKSTTIRKRAQEANSELLVLNISGDQDPASLEDRFLNLQK